MSAVKNSHWVTDSMNLSALEENTENCVVQKFIGLKARLFWLRANLMTEQK